MPEDELIQPDLKLKFQTEKIRRAIFKCNDISVLREIAIELLELHQKKSSVANWAAKRAFEAEKECINYNFSIDKFFNVEDN